MGTIVVHGTMTHKAAHHYTWWWNSWGPRGFINALASGMQEAGRTTDVWKINGKNVSEIPELQPKGNFWTGRMGQFRQHQGHFMWDGADMGPSREAAAANLVKYLNALHLVAPQEPLRIVAHSHGCNVVKMASASRKLSPPIHFKQAVFLACPHFQGVDKTTYTYKLKPERFGKILNLYSPYDSVQTKYAESVTGLPGKLADYIPVNSFRVNQDPEAQRAYENWQILTASQGTVAHSDMHGGVIGFVAGRWLAENESFASIVKQIDSRLLPIPAGDDGA